MTDQDDARRIALALPETVELETLIADAWRCQAPKALVKAFEGGICEIAVAAMRKRG